MMDAHERRIVQLYFRAPMQLGEADYRKARAIVEALQEAPREPGALSPELYQALGSTTE